MRKFHFIVPLCLAVMTSACGSLDVTSRNAVGHNDIPASTLKLRASYQVNDVRVGFAPGTTVSEANRYYPQSDIVWREDPLGDRKAQVGAIVSAAMERGVASMRGSVPVVLDISVTRFHALTRKTRYSSLPATHAIRFDLTVRHQKTGAILEGPRRVDATFDAYTGEAALAAEARGETQKVRITQHLASVIQRELSSDLVMASR